MICVRLHLAATVAAVCVLSLAGCSSGDAKTDSPLYADVELLTAASEAPLWGEFAGTPYFQGGEMQMSNSSGEMTTNVSYLGSAENGDSYSIKIRHDGKEVVAKEFLYKGHELEVYSHDDWGVYLMPPRKSAKPEFPNVRVLVSTDQGGGPQDIWEDTDGELTVRRDFISQESSAGETLKVFVKYIESDATGDLYSLTVRLNGKEVISKDVHYEGKELGVFLQDEWKVSLAPPRSQDQ